jgi:hypothetical protein
MPDGQEVYVGCFVLALPEEVVATMLATPLSGFLAGQVAPSMNFDRGQSESSEGERPEPAYKLLTSFPLLPNGLGELCMVLGCDALQCRDAEQKDLGLQR